MAARVTATRLTRVMPRLYPLISLSRLRPTIVNHLSTCTLKPASVFSRRLLTTQLDNTPVVSGSCSGCGATLQEADSNGSGYIERKPERKSQPSKPSGPSVLSDEDYQQHLDTLDPELKELLGIKEEANERKDDVPKTTSRQLCSRCHSLIHHKTSTTSDTQKFLRSALQYTSLSFLKTKNNALIVSIIDIGDIPFSIEPLIAELNSNPTHRVLLVANKIDILPKDALKHQQRIKDWIVQQAKRSGLNTASILDVALVSAIKGWGIKSLLRSIESYRNSTDDVYVLGCTNVGKSAVVNAFLKQGAAKKEDVSDYAKQHTARVRREYQVTSSHVPGTTIGSIKIPLRVVGIRDPLNNDEANKRFVTKERYIVDTPGIINEDQLVHLLAPDEVRKWEASKELKPVTYRLEAGMYLDYFRVLCGGWGGIIFLAVRKLQQGINYIKTLGKSLLLKPFIRLDLVKSTQPILITLFTKMIPHFVKTEKLNDDTNAIDRSISLKSLPHTIKLHGDHPSHATADIAFSSMGWISVTGEFDRAELRVWVPTNAGENAIDVRSPPLLPYEYKGSIRKFYGSGERSRQ
jgi:ribosome biogenesis GTPase A